MKYNGYTYPYIENIVVRKNSTESPKEFLLYLKMLRAAGTEVWSCIKNIINFYEGMLALLIENDNNLLKVYSIPSQ